MSNLHRAANDRINRDGITGDAGMLTHLHREEIRQRQPENESLLGQEGVVRQSRTPVTRPPTTPTPRGSRVA